MAWYFWLIIVVIAFGIGIPAGIFIDKLGIKMYYKRLTGSASGGASIAQRALKFDKDNLQLKQADVVFVGDSITEGYNLETYFPNKNYVNRGISGDKSGGVLNRINSNVIALAPKKIVLLIGTNDMHDNISATQVFENTKATILEICSNLPQCVVFVEGIYPINENMDGYSRGLELNKKFCQVNANLAALANGKNIIYIDTYNALLDKTNNLTPAYTRDGLHLLPAGYDVVTKLLTKALDK
ncbi:MAG: GDSL-type esterase/lipase family protein [Clostridia bacterium]